MKIIFLILLAIKLLAFEMIKPIVYDINKININDYLVSEKLDGVRAYWDGKNLYSKNKNIYDIPQHLKDILPPFAIDGELYCGKIFEETLSDVLSNKFSCVKYYIFEVPNQEGNLLERLAVLEKYLNTNKNDFIKIIPQIHFSDKKEFDKYFNDLISDGAEGVVLHLKDIAYSTKASLNVIKYKKYFDDECIIRKVNLNDGLLKSYECEWEITDKQIKIHNIKNIKEKKKIINIGSGFSKKHRENPLKIGDIITFKYYKLSKNLVPIHCVFLRQRKNF